MKVSDLCLQELLHETSAEGVLRFAGQRALLLDASALGLLRRELIHALGRATARTVLLRFGYAHGWMLAEKLRDSLPWESVREWQLAGGRLHTLQGLVRVVPVAPDPTDDDPPFAEALWHDSFEAEQHLLHVGRDQDPVCWTLCGFASGYMSRCHEEDILVMETQCVGRGDPHCRIEARTRAAWGETAERIWPAHPSCAEETSWQELAARLEAVDHRLRQREERLERVGGERNAYPGLVGQSAPFLRAVTLAERVAGVDASVLLHGESGVGKERFARMIHELSDRAGGPFVAVNCAALPPHLLESELFGHARGAFTGALRDRMGLFEAARGGTLLLDEVGDMPPDLQVRMLRVLQEREIRRVGENRARSIDVRVIAATHRDLAQEVGAGRFRMDLLYRLRVLELRVPPLRERRDDILLLARTFLEAKATRMGRPVPRLLPDAADALLGYTWPGNVRELENVVERALVVGEGRQIGLQDLPPELRATSHEEPARDPAPSPNVLAQGGPPQSLSSLAAVEAAHIDAVLEAVSGRRAEAARVLGISEATLYRRLAARRGDALPDKGD